MAEAQGSPVTYELHVQWGGVSQSGGVFEAGALPEPGEQLMLDDGSMVVVDEVLPREGEPALVRATGR